MLETEDSVRILLIDTCGEVGSVALASDNLIVASAGLPARTASSALLTTVRTLLEQNDWQKSDLHAVGVVSGPGSFTGMRVGLAAAKGLCEALGLPLAAVSRLEVLAETGDLDHGFAILDAGRGELYVRQVGSGGDREYLSQREALISAAAGQRVCIAESRLADSLGELHPEIQTLSARTSLPLVLRALQAGVEDLGSIDANYVRSEGQIYGKQQMAPQGDKA